MNPLQISWKSLLYHKWTFFLNVLLIAFGTGILTLLLIGTTQIGDKLRGNARGIDLVVGAKGSPLQLILSSIYFIDFPTGNISLADANQLAKNPMVKRAVPLALGDNYFGYRIVGTDSSFINLYQLKLSQGKFWKRDFEVVIGSEVARNRKLKVGDTFHGSHGLTSGEEGAHEGHPDRVTGILEPAGNTTDNLILTNISTIWDIHGIEAGEQNDKREITSLLIQYRSRMAMIVLPLFVNKSTSMQAASPAKESARLFSLIGVGVETMQWFAISLMFIAGISVFVSLYNSLKERMYDLAIMRVMGASQFRLFLIIILEGIILTSIGSALGIILGHFTLEIIGHFQDSSQARLSGFFFLKDEFYLIAAGLIIGILASVIPAVQAYRADISKTISKG
ncbi:ABC transporter permease [Dyadobacter frigoris]|uniref:FtsX-like permease family protein n=1 Tax=Dyadobacter frigoris TaxID=2576211 RepID=A0A4U6D4Y7_9BACT|nr:FtsX-like permease family protein [Dyadobacter frigoris]TKT92342.1 FtsX-like permease family protein [Dyadobacter frigoris]GLU53530.1 ABC transporter permease [Dyadobacter frigoris]